MRRAAKGLGRVAPEVELIATSPLVRARQTAEILARRLGAPVVETDRLSPGAEPEDFLAWLEGRRERAVALVGHEPHLGILIGWLCAGEARPLTVLKKGQACLVELEAARAGAGRLVWSLAPSQLRRLGS